VAACRTHPYEVRDDDGVAWDATFDRDGFVRLAGFAEPGIGRAIQDDVVATTRAATTGVADDGALVLPEANLRDREGAPEERTSKVFRLHRRPDHVAFLRRPEVVALVVDRLGPDVDCFLSQFIFKNPGAWGQPWHQDSYYFPFSPARPVVGLWLAVSEATLENGCLHVLPGSHAEPVHAHVPDRRPDANLGYVEIVDHDMGAAVPVLMDPGDLLVFDSHLMHRSTDNDSAGVRAAMVWHLAPAGTVDRSEELGTGGSIVNDWMPLVRDGAPVAAAVT
jgi:phytanoyl-CoA hydroxylase